MNLTSHAGGHRILWVLGFACLAPVWLFPYIPTQDGPSHLANAVIMREYHSPGARYAEFFAFRVAAFPNWTAPLLLTSLLSVFPPLIAEKVLVSTYIVAFAWGFQYYLGSFSKGCAYLAPLGLLFVYNRCFLLGFYGFCLSLPIYCVAIGYYLRRRSTPRAGPAAVLTGLFLVAYFTHLVGYVLAVASILAYWLSSRPTRARELYWVVIAVAPSAILMFGYLQRMGFFGPRGSEVIAGHIISSISAPATLCRNCAEATALNAQWFQVYDADCYCISTLAFLLYTLLFLITLLSPRSGTVQRAHASLPLATAFIVTGLSIAYYLMPDDIGEHGGYLKARIALFLPLLALGCFRAPSALWAQRLLTVLVCLLVGYNLVLVTKYFRAMNEVLVEFTAGADRIGSHRTLVVVLGRHAGEGRDLVDPLEHASHYYCLHAGNISFANYHAMGGPHTPYPVRFRGVKASERGDPFQIEGPLEVDVVVTWDLRDRRREQLGPQYHELFRGGRLAVYALRND